MLRPLLFRGDPEQVHDLGMQLLRTGVFASELPSDPRWVVERNGIRFENPVGLAAGFDKNGLAAEQWGDLGFGFAELGTVTALAQPGNPKPRLFRLPEDHAIINRMGFNNEGSASLAARLENSRTTIPIGVNLGKSKVTPLLDAPEDYATSHRRLAHLADYIVINVSSPNTPGLRNLQAKPELMRILEAIRACPTQKPLFVKIAPDLAEPDLDDILDVANSFRLDGLIATNTTLDRTGLTNPLNESGGLSGRPIRAKSEAVLGYLARNAPKHLTLIGVGGIETANDIKRRFQLGAHLVQVYTGWVYGGPYWVPQTLRQLQLLMDADGIGHVHEWRFQTP